MEVFPLKCTLFEKVDTLSSGLVFMRLTKACRPWSVSAHKNLGQAYRINFFKKGTLQRKNLQGAHDHGHAYGVAFWNEVLFLARL